MDEELIKKLNSRIETLERKVEELTVKRIYQQDVVPQAVKNRHMGEANSYVYNALTDTDLPGKSVDIGTQIYYKEVDSTLYIWNSVTEVWDVVGRGATFTIDADAVGTITFDMTLYDYHEITIAGNRTFAVSNVEVGDAFAIEVIQGGAGSNLVTWFSGILWDGSITPTLSTAVGKRDLFIFKCVAAGVYLGLIGGKTIG